MFFRAFYAIPQTMRGPGGTLVNAVRGTLDTLARYVTDRRPRHIAFTTDEDWRPDWRVELIPAYKQQRTAEPIPPALIPQVPIILAALEAVGVDVVGLEGYEAEDIVATLAAKVKTPIEIASGDRDLFTQVRGRDIIVLYPQKGGMIEVDEAEIARKYGIPGRAYADYAILRGDPSDGLPGVRGVGEKTASLLISKYGSLDGVLEASRGARGGPLGKVAADADYVRRAAEVVRMKRDCGVGNPDPSLGGTPSPKLKALARELALNGPVDRLLRAIAGRG